MRKLVFFVHATLDGFIAKADDDLWKRFPWGEDEMTFNTDVFRTADTWVLGRRMYEAIVPWWTEVAQGSTPEGAEQLSAADREFGDVFGAMTVIAVSKTLDERDGASVISDPVAGLTALKRQPGKDILLSCGSALLASVAGAPGLVDEYLIVVHPVALGSGRPMFGRLRHELALDLVETRSFPGGCVALRYHPTPPGSDPSAQRNQARGLTPLRSGMNRGA